MNRRSFLWTPLALAAVRSSVPLLGAGPKPNIVLITASGWRQQSVPWSGNTDVVAPNLARFAGRATTYSRVYASYPRAELARLSLRTGVFPHALPPPAAKPGGDGSAPVLENDADQPETPPPGLSALLRTAGFRTGEFSSLQAGDVITFVHEPASAPFLVEWTFEDIDAQLLERRDASGIHLRENVPPPSQDAARVDLNNFYSRALSRDRDIGLVLEALDRPGLTDNTLIIFTADRGQQFGSHGINGSDCAYEESMRIPLAIRFPRSIGRGKPGGENDALISQTDILPSILKLCGLAIPQTAQGRDLSAVLLGSTADRPQEIYAEGRIGEKDEWRMLVHGFDKIVVDMEGHVTQLYNLSDDPLEQNNRAEVSADLLKRDALIAMQKAWAHKLSDGMDASGFRRRKA